MELRPGRNQTEMRVIPKGWEVRRLDEVVDFLDGRRRPVKDSDRAKMRGEIPYYGASGIVDYVNDYIFDDELILLGEDGENILSRNCRLAFRIAGKAWVNNHAHVLKPRPGNDIGYLAEFLESLNYDQYNTGTAQPKLNKQVCSGIPVLCPSLPEQRGIAGALGDVDAMIGALSRLIAKKRDLKQAAMQQLLTGQTRLPGFSGEWAYRELRSFVRDFVVPMRDKPKRFNGEIPWCRIEDFDGKYLTHSRSGQHVDEQTIRDMNLKVYPTGTLLVSCSADLGRCAIVGRPLITNQTFIGLVLDEAVSSNEFMYYYMSYKAEELNSLSSGTTISYLSREQFETFPVLIPSKKSEQTTIATVLSDMDAELAALEERLAKTRALKQGMMQELLTGRTRLTVS